MRLIINTNNTNRSWNALFSIQYTKNTDNYLCSCGLMDNEDIPL